MSTKKLLKSTINRLGFDLHKLPDKETSILPLKTEGKLGVYKTPLGNFYLPMDAPEDVVINCIKEGNIFEPEVVEVAKRFIKEGTAVLDVGANFGQMSLIFADLTGSDGIVYSFEAQKSIFDMLKKNLSINNIHNVEALFNAVYFESNKTFHFPEPDFQRFASYGSYNLPLDAAEGQEVKSLKIDDIKIEKPISFMKVDIQGCDLFAMQGAVETIKKHRMPILFEFEQQFQDEYQTNFQDYVDFVNSIEYKFVEVILHNYLIVHK